MGPIPNVYNVDKTIRSTARRGDSDGCTARFFKSNDFSVNIVTCVVERGQLVRPALQGLLVETGPKTCHCGDHRHSHQPTYLRHIGCVSN